jgi:hypothetical protein
MTLRGPATERHHPARRGQGRQRRPSDGGGGGPLPPAARGGSAATTDELPALINDVIRAIPARATERSTYLHDEEQ